MGNSEVGHLNIGAGRIVYQNLETINKDIQDEGLEKNQILLEAINKAKKAILITRVIHNSPKTVPRTK